MSKNNVTLKTYTKTSSNTKDIRNVTIWYSYYFDEFTLLGNLSHGTELIIDQKLIDDLQRLLKEINCKE